ncbi:ARF GAP with effector function(s) [Conoideocrella luteorostrata]|uniref:ARF GAP with effector function(S) n=1 Tax=Conoideocrella luteorostrata TaxID=1105319 RepID=A0AAJ0CSM8_9HYPO|nr:ARF GAP with effector function(s) [Conoideocrella luteorostrata]
MSRRAPNPAAERAAQNQATIKNLLKLEPNKVCADCKRNKHPRWASWNLGIFVCIRCSGIHRGMGTHISRVKSVDLDSWTDEQLQSVLNWGNARANKYWEAKLAPGHSPSEAKIENFIRTKYELKRWVMDGPKPDPATLDVDGDDDVPLSLVREKQVIERKESIRKASVGSSQAPRNIPAPEGDLIGGHDPAPSRANLAGPSSVKVAPKAEPVAPKTTNTRDSLLGLDFLGGSTAPPRPASTPGVASPGIQSRPDLKQSILSLYASAPKPQPQQTPQQQAFGGIGSPIAGNQRPGSTGAFNDAFSSLNLSNPAGPKPAAADPFANLGSAHSSTRATPQASNSNAFSGLSGGGFFDTKPAQPAVSSHQQKPSNSGFGGFLSFSSPPPTQTAVASVPKPAPKPAQPSSSAMGDLFDLSAPITQTSPPPQIASPPATANSVFNLSSPQNKPAAPAPTTTSNAFGSGGLSGADVWGTNEWASSAPVAAAPAPAPRSPEQPKSAAADFGWGNTNSTFASTPIVPGAGGGFNPAPKVTADEEFGGWAGSTGASNRGPAPAPKQSGGFGGDEDLFSNVWQ